jgi:hypothetical protein
MMSDSDLLLEAEAMEIEITVDESLWNTDRDGTW